ncbi:gustatory receptor for sugar taste 43a-like isoform X1 [Bradysia coprophila]|uniref:gustatory receptor for sugar taste 43a-like isoform X1 n=1 Tax=Bradysia coprophila TaxID=38358 RepID=UPI00187DD17C|nr:gustatory receptor for sugar taste 43a-like isoform X1 [Bradysia coprophila]
MEINEASLPVFYVSRIFGYAPYRIERTVSGKFKGVLRSIPIRIYSVVLLSTLALLCAYGMYCDVVATVTLRMKSTTARIATVFDVNIIGVSCLFGVLSGTVGFDQMLEINRRLKEVDEILLIYIDRDKESRRRALKLLLPIYTAILSLLALDVFGWYRQALKIKETDPLAVNVVNNLYWYAPFYTLYIFLLTLQIQFTHLSWSLGTRYQRLNLALKYTFYRERSFLHQKNVAFGITSTNEFPKIEKAINNAPRRDRAAYLHNIYLKNFAYVHETLGKTVISISSYFGITLLMLLSSCLLHLTVTAYFLILSLLDQNALDPFHISLQAVWLVFHTFRLLLIVEPCNMTSAESSHTTHLVCNILRDRPKSAILESFWQQLIAKETYFTAHGICRIDRSILTTVLWSITTYLVILLQFEKIYG